MTESGPWLESAEFAVRSVDESPPRQARVGRQLAVAATVFLVGIAVGAGTRPPLAPTGSPVEIAVPALVADPTDARAKPMADAAAPCIPFDYRPVRCAGDPWAEFSSRFPRRSR